MQLVQYLKMIGNEWTFFVAGLLFAGSAIAWIYGALYSLFRHFEDGNALFGQLVVFIGVSVLLMWLRINATFKPGGNRNTHRSESTASQSRTLRSRASTEKIPPLLETRTLSRTLDIGDVFRGGYYHSPPPRVLDYNIV